MRLKKLFSTIGLAVLIFSASIFSGYGAVSQVPVDISSNVVGCYYTPLAGPAIDKIPFKLYTHVFYAFVKSGIDGKIIDRQIHAERLKKIKESAKAEGTLVVISIGGGSYKDFPAIMKNKETAELYVNELMGLLKETGCDGIDVDWEFVLTEAEGYQFSDLTQKLKDGLKKIETENNRKLLLTAAVNGGDWGCKWISDEAASKYDFLNVMTYDMAGFSGKLAAHHAPLFESPDDPRKVSCANRMAYWTDKRKYPKEKLAFGIPAYARGVDNYAPYEVIADAPDKKVWEKGWNKVALMIEKDGWIRKYDEKSKSPWFFSPDGKSFCGCDDPESVKTKTEWAKKQGYRGVFFWAMSHDVMPDGSFPLSTAAHNAWFSK